MKENKYYKTTNQLNLSMQIMNSDNEIDTDSPANIRRHWRCSVIYIVNFEQIPHLFLAFLLLIWNK